MLTRAAPLLRVGFIFQLTVTLSSLWDDELRLRTASHALI